MTKPVDRSIASPSRRRFIVSAAAAGGGLTLGFAVPFDAVAAAAQRAAAPVEVNAWVVIRPDDTCVIRIARSEMGQGTLTGLAQLVTEELECDWNKVTYEFPTPGESLGASAYGASSAPAAAAASASPRTTFAAAAPWRASCCCRRRPTGGRCRCRS